MDASFSPSINEENLAGARAQGNWGGLLNEINGWLTGFSRVRLAPLSDRTLSLLSRSASVIDYFLADPNASYPRESLRRFLTLHQAFTVVRHLVGSDYVPRLGNTDLSSRPHLWNYSSARSDLRLSLDRILQVDSLLGSEWYGQYLFGARAFVSKEVIYNLLDHLRTWSDQLVLVPSVSNGYMRSTYIDTEVDRLWKGRFNQRVKRSLAGLNISNKGQSKKIAVLTARWAKNHPTYKNRYLLFKALSEHFPLTLIHLGPERNDLERDLFADVRHVQLTKKGLNIDALKSNDFQVAFYPDIGMNVESRFLSNLRISPIQLTTNSHPVSTFGSEIDYFLTGAASELDPTVAHRHYEERLILVPGIGTQPNTPDVPAARELTRSIQQPHTGVIKVACPWGCLKINHNLIGKLKDIRQMVSPTIDVNFCFLVTLGTDNNHHLSLYKDLKDALGTGIELYNDLPYDAYMARYAECHFALDAFPFGGNTSIVDAIYLGIPIVCQRGWQFYNLAGPVILKKAGLEELVAENTLRYVELATRLATEPTYRTALRNRLTSINVNDVLGELCDTESYVKAIDYLINERPAPNVREPIMIR